MRGYAVTAVVAAALGSGATYLAVQVKLAALEAQNASLRSQLQEKHWGGQDTLSEGNAAFDRKDWPTAIAEYTQAIAGGVDTPDVRTDLGTALRNAGQPQKALEQYQIAQRENPRHENSLFNQGVVYLFDLNQPAQALAVWQQYLQRFPGGQHAAEARHLVAELQAHGAPAGAGASRP